MDKIRMTIRLKFKGQAPSRKQILKAFHRIPFGPMIVEQAKRRIDHGGDSQVRYKPLWADTFRSHSGGTSYRAGGKPLLDTRQHVYNTLNAETHKTSTGMEIRLRGSLAAVFHHNGFKTNGPNFIPLTRRAVRDHRPGADPRHEGLVRGVDYIMMWKGVTVPARPIFRLAPEDKRDIIKTVELHLRKTFRTKRKVA